MAVSTPRTPLKPTGAVVVALTAWVLSVGSVSTTAAFEYGVLSDLHLSVRDELGEGRSFQVDNTWAVDAYRILGAFDFHSDLRLTSDLNLFDEEAAQLDLAYIDADRLIERLGVRAGRQFFAEGFGPFIGDGLRVAYRAAPWIGLSVHYGVPFDAENEAISAGSARIYGGQARLTGVYGSGSRVVTLLQLERHEGGGPDAPDRTLIGVETSVEVSRILASDLYGDLEFDAESSSFRRIKGGVRLYPTPRMSVRLEGERYEPRPKLRRGTLEILGDSILPVFAGSEVTAGRIGVDRQGPGKGTLRMTYSGQRYLDRAGVVVWGHLVDLFFETPLPWKREATLGLGYTGRLVEDDFVHLGVLRAGLGLSPLIRLGLLAETGVMENRYWGREPVVHVRVRCDVAPRPNLEIAFVCEENVNPYFDSDLRGMVLIRYFWTGRIP